MLFYKWIKKLYYRDIQGDENAAINKYRKDFNDLKEQSDRSIQIALLEQYIDKPIICISDSNQILIGYGKDITFITQAQQPMLKVFDLLTDEEYIVFGKIFFYSDEILHLFYNNPPDHYLPIMYGGHPKRYKIYNVRNKQTIQEVLDILHRKDFFKHYEFIKDQKNETHDAGYTTTDVGDVSGESGQQSLSNQE